MAALETYHRTVDDAGSLPSATAPPSRHWLRRHRLAAVMIGVGCLLGASTYLWTAAVAPAFVKYPTDLDVSLSYAGTFRLFADPSTFQPLDEPIEAQLTVERHLDAIGDQSGSSRVLVDETIDQHAGTILDLSQHNIYVMDRREMVNLSDERAFAFDPANVVDRSGAYRLQLPFDTEAQGTYMMYINETDSTYGLVGTNATYERDGLTLSEYSVDAPYAPLTDAYLAELREGVPLPETLTFDQMKPFLLRAGLDADKLVGTLTQELNAKDLEQLLVMIAEPIRLRYFLSSEGSVGIDRTTGSEVDVSRVAQTLAVAPESAQVDPLHDVLAKYSDVPAIADAAGLVAGLSSQPIPVAEYEYAQTDQSVAETADEVKSQRDQIRLAETWIPFALGAAGAVLGVAGVVLVIVQRRRTLADGR
jgi:hypothetical protein